MTKSGLVLCNLKNKDLRRSIVTEKRVRNITRFMKERFELCESGAPLRLPPTGSTRENFPFPRLNAQIEARHNQERIRFKSFDHQFRQSN
jgi:hypothetical protein